MRIAAVGKQARTAPASTGYERELKKRKQCGCCTEDEGHLEPRACRARNNEVPRNRERRVSECHRTLLPRRCRCHTHSSRPTRPPRARAAMCLCPPAHQPRGQWPQRWARRLCDRAAAGRAACGPERANALVPRGCGMLLIGHSLVQPFAHRPRQPRRVFCRKVVSSGGMHSQRRSQAAC